MVNRTKISKEIRRRTGGVSHGTKPKGKVTTNLSQKDWEKIPGTGTSPNNPPKYRMKKEAKARQQSKFKVEQAKKKEKATKPKVEALYKGAREGAPYARLTGAVRRGAERARKEQLAKDIRSRDIDDFPAQPRNRAILGELKRAQDIKRRSVSPPTTPRPSVVPLSPVPRAQIGIQGMKRRRSPELLPAIPTDVPISERRRIEPRIDRRATPADVAATPTASKTGGKVSKSKGGTVKKKHGGKLHKNRKTYGGHDGNKYVSKLYK